MPAFSRFEVALGKAREFQEETGSVLTKATLVGSEFLFPHLEKIGSWTHMVTFDMVRRDHRKREKSRCIANSIAQMRRVNDLDQVDEAIEA